MGSKGKGRWRQNKGSGNGPSVPKNAKGVLVTFEPTFERPAIREAMDVLTSCCEELSSSTEKSCQDAADQCDASKALEEELKELRGGSQSPLVCHETNANGTVFIGFKDGYDGPGPIELVQHILEKALESGVSRTRRCIRFLPVLYSCNSQYENIEEMGKLLVAKEFDSGENATPVSFSVELDRRSLPRLSRSRVIDAFATPIPQPPHSVDLTNPSKVIITQVVRDSCTAAVMDGAVFRRLNKCNIRACCEAFQNSKDGKPEKAGSDCPQVETCTGDGANGGNETVNGETEGGVEETKLGEGEVLGKRGRSEDGEALTSRKVAAVGDQRDRSVTDKV
ncbi:hypothetical protein BSKO_09143 [Bryopsis sp. KO-2023]|nr:hypothetical protein BSKO_09143 [Bryopsis sp. KO-2023]